MPCLQVGFPKRDPQKLSEALVHTHTILWIRSNRRSRWAKLGQLLGFARATSDGALSATIWDVAVSHDMGSTPACPQQAVQEAVPARQPVPCTACCQSGALLATIWHAGEPCLPRQPVLCTARTAGWLNTSYQQWGTVRNHWESFGEVRHRHCQQLAGPGPALSTLLFCALHQLSAHDTLESI